jgi:hypothetical protein
MSRLADVNEKDDSELAPGRQVTNAEYRESAPSVDILWRRWFAASEHE